VAKVGTSNPDSTISLKMLQCLVENEHNIKKAEVDKVMLHNIMYIISFNVTT